MIVDAEGRREVEGIVARVFIVGCARSGTTLLQSLLAAHPRIRSFPESHFFSWIRRSDIESARGLMDRFLDQAGLSRLWSAEASIESRGEFVERFIEVLDRATVEAGRDVWVEKTPHHVHYIPDIERAVPGARFVHILRNGPDTILSMHRVTREHPAAWGAKRSIPWCTRRWVRDIRISLQCIDDPDHHLLRYETLTTYPETTLRVVCRFLGVPFTEEMIADHRAAADAIVRPGETWKLDARDEIRPSPRPSTQIRDLKLDDDLRSQLATTQEELDDTLPPQ